jgi:hypothetical protein
MAYMGDMADLPATDVRFVIEVARDHGAQTVADRLRDTGLAIERVLPRVGIVGGHGPETLRGTISRTPGVDSVREEGVFQLPPLREGIPQ